MTERTPATRHSTSRPLSGALRKGAIVGLVADVLGATVALCALVVLHTALQRPTGLLAVGDPLLIKAAFVLMLVAAGLLMGLASGLFVGAAAGAGLTLLLRHLGRRDALRPWSAPLLGAALWLVHVAPIVLLVEGRWPDAGLFFVRSAWRSPHAPARAGENWLWMLALVAPIGASTGALAGRWLAAWLEPPSSPGIE